jgi:hypothetical protein
MLTMIYMTRIQNMSFFLFKVNNPSVCHLFWPRWAPRLALRLAPLGHSVSPRWAPHLALLGTLSDPSGTPSGPRWAPHPAPVGSEKKIIISFLVVVVGWKRGEKIFRFSIPEFLEFPELPELCGLHGRSREKNKVFSA